MNKRFFQKLMEVVRYLTQPIFVLLWTTITVYAVFIPLLGFYWDDLAIQWISEVFGTAGLARYFSTNRPIWGLFYQINTSLLGKEPWIWQIFGLFWRWVAACGLYLLLKKLWQGRSEPALIGALIFVVYPGFGGQFIATVFGHFFLVLSAFFFSVYFSLAAIDAQKHKSIITTAAILLSAVNVFSMEYFFMLELMRPIFFILYQTQSDQKWKILLKQAVIRWVPYLSVFLAAGIWRSFIFGHQTENYSPKLIILLKTDFFAGLGTLFANIFQDYWLSLIAAWGKVFQIPNINTFGKSASLLSFGIGVLIIILISSVFIINKKRTVDNKNRKWAYWAIITGLIAVLPAGVPFWITSLPLKLSFPNDRFVLPYLLAVSLFLTGILYSIPFKRWMRLVLVTVFLAGAGMVQVRNGIQYERDWEQQSRLFWQLSWRMPSIEPGTIIYAPELPLQYFSDNSITSTLNWMYEVTSDPERIPYLVFYPSVRVGKDIKTLEPNTQISHDLLVGYFHGNTSQAVAINYDPPACLRVLDPEIEQDNWMVSNQVREFLNLTSFTPIRMEEKANLPAYLYGAEPEKNWCYYFQKADLARQFKDWGEISRLGEIAFALDDNPNDPAERFPFIEGYAHTGNWDRAVQLTQETAEITPVMHPPLCNLWERINTEAEDSPEKQASLQTVLNQLECKTD